MACLDEVLREQPGPAAELPNETATREGGFEDVQDPGCDPFRVEREPFVMDARQIRSVVRRDRHATVIVAQRTVAAPVASHPAPASRGALLGRATKPVPSAVRNVLGTVGGPGR